MDFDEAELDMIRRGDMLGPKLGAKVATALETLQRERDEAARIAKDTAVALTGQSGLALPIVSKGTLSPSPSSTPP